MVWIAIFDQAVALRCARLHAVRSRAEVVTSSELSCQLGGSASEQSTNGPDIDTEE
jgi:hypothetical protein